MKIKIFRYIFILPIIFFIVIQSTRRKEEFHLFKNYFSKDIHGNLLCFDSRDIIMQPCDKSTYQKWTKEFIERRYFFIRNGEHCIDLDNNGMINISLCDDQSNSQKWIWIEPHMKNWITDYKYCLDIVNDVDKNKLRMNVCGRYSGQYWVFQHL